MSNAQRSFPTPQCSTRLQSTMIKYLKQILWWRYEQRNRETGNTEDTRPAMPATLRTHQQHHEHPRPTWESEPPSAGSSLFALMVHITVKRKTHQHQQRSFWKKQRFQVFHKQMNFKISIYLWIPVTNVEYLPQKMFSRQLDGFQGVYINRSTS